MSYIYEQPGCPSILAWPGKNRHLVLILGKFNAFLLLAGEEMNNKNVLNLQPLSPHQYSVNKM